MRKAVMAMALVITGSSAFAGMSIPNLSLGAIVKKPIVHSCEFSDEI